MLSISATEDWHASHPGASIGVLELSGLENEGACPQLEERKRAAEGDLRGRYRDFSRQDLLTLPILSAYGAYYRRFKKTYHVQLQVESIALKGKRLPTCLLQSTPASWRRWRLSCSRRDTMSAKLSGSIVIDASREGDHIVQMGGAFKDLRPGDMIMRDAQGVCCSIIYGQDDRSPISPESSHVLYVAYAPAGVPPERVDLQLRSILENVRLCSPTTVVEQRRLISSTGGAPEG